MSLAVYWKYHCILPVAALNAIVLSVNRLSPPEAPMMMESFSASGAAVISRSGWSPSFLSQTIWPLSLSVAITRPSSPVTEMTRLLHSATPRLRSGFCWPGSIFHSTAHGARAHVDLVDHAPHIGDVEHAVL